MEDDLKSAFTEALQDAEMEPTAQPADPAPDEPTNETPSLKPRLAAFLFAMFGTTLPSEPLNTLFGILTLVTLLGLALGVWQHRNTLTAKQLKVVILSVAGAFILSGCTGLSLQWVDDPPTPLVITQNPDKEYKKGFSEGYALFGFGLSDINEATAMQNGNITKSYAIIKYSSYGWISMAKVWAYGE